jgi:hypothetical protein
MAKAPVSRDLEDRLGAIEKRLAALEKAVGLVDALFIPEILDSLVAAAGDLHVSAESDRLEGFYPPETPDSGVPQAWVQYESGARIGMFLIQGVIYIGVLRIGKTKNIRTADSLVLKVADRTLEKQYNWEDDVYEFSYNADYTGWHYFELNSEDPFIPSEDGSSDIRVLGPMFHSLELAARNF